MYKQTYPCPICGETANAVTSPNFLAREEKTYFENDSIMEILNLKTCEVSLIYCDRCFHYFTHPLFDDHLLYGERQARIRKELYPRYFDEKAYNNSGDRIKEILEKNKNYLQNISTFFEILADKADRLDLGKRPIKVLDYGAGDGKFISLLHHLNKDHDSSFDFYAFDYHRWIEPAEDIEFIESDLDTLRVKGPYDLIICTNVLEHTANPNRTLELFNDISRSNTYLYLEVPLQYHFKKIAKIKGNKAFLHYHQQTFSLFSLQRLLELNQWSIIKGREVLNDFYRGSKEATIKILSLKGGERSFVLNRFRYKVLQLVNLIRLSSGIIINRLSRSV